MSCPNGFGSLVRTGGYSAMAVLTNREGELRKEEPLAQVAHIDRAYWFDCRIEKQRIEVTLVDVWNSRSLPASIPPQGTQAAGNVAWLALLGPPATLDVMNPKVHLCYGWSKRAQVPDFHETSVGPVEFTAVPVADNQTLAFACSGWKRLHVILLGPGQNTRIIAEFRPKGQARGELSDLGAAVRPDGYALFWRYYNKRIRREERDGGIFFCALDTSLDRLTGVQRLSPNREIPAGRVKVFDFGQHSMVVWRDGLSDRRHEIRYVDFETLGQLPTTPKRFPGPFPDAVVETEKGLLALATIFSQEPYGWTIEAHTLASVR